MSSYFEKNKKLATALVDEYCDYVALRRCLNDDEVINMFAAEEMRSFIEIEHPKVAEYALSNEDRGLKIYFNFDCI